MKKLGFGLMRLPVDDLADWSGIDMDEMRVMVDKFIGAGFTYFDTAYVYHQGNSERAFGELVAARYPRDRYTITTKMPVFMVKDRSDYPRIFAEQLERCRVDYFDYYLLHAIGRSTYPDICKMQGFEFLRQMKERGKVKHIGFSFHDDAEALEMILSEQPCVELVLLQLNYVDWEDLSVQSKACYEVCVKHGKKVAVMEPLKGGALVKLPEEAVRLMHSCHPYASFASWGLRFAASLEHVMVVLSGMSNLEQMKDNILVMDQPAPLNAEEYDVLNEVAKIVRGSTPIPCTGCRYCVDDCPKRIDIPRHFALYNNQHRFKLRPGHHTTFANLVTNHGKPSECIACRQCERHCPQHLPIADMLKLVAGVFEA